MNKHRDKKSSLCKGPKGKYVASLRKNKEPLLLSTEAGRVLERMLAGNQGPRDQECHRVHCKNFSYRNRKPRKGLRRKVSHLTSVFKGPLLKQGDQSCGCCSNRGRRE